MPDQTTDSVQFSSCCQHHDNNSPKTTKNSKFHLECNQAIRQMIDLNISSLLMLKPVDPVSKFCNIDICSSVVSAGGGSLRGSARLTAN